MTRPDSLPFTGDDEADRLLAENPVALLIGMVLYQQVPVEKAFQGPAELQRRLGKPLDAATIAAMDPEELEELFRRKPALHRFPANMAKRTHAVATYLQERYDGETARLWEGAADTGEVVKRMMDLPGFGEYKARVYFGVLAKRLGIRPDGWEEQIPDWPSIADVEKPGDLDELKARKKAWKESGGG